MIVAVAACARLLNAAGSSGSTATIETERAKLLFIAPTFNIQGAGMSIDAIKQIGERLIGMLRNKIGIEVEYEMAGGPNMDQDAAMSLALERMRKGGDLSWTDYPHYESALKEGIPIGIISLMEIGGSIVYKNCFYALRNSPYKKAADLRGLRTAGGPTLDWVGMRALLYANHIDEKPDEFFSDMAPMSSFFATLNGVLLKRIDVVMMSEPAFKVLKKNNPNYEKIAPVLCAEVSPNAYIPIYRKGLDPKILEALRTLLADAHEDRDMGFVRPFMEAADVRFVEPDEDALKQIGALYRQAEERGWTKEAKRYQATYKAVNAKKSRQKCRDNCKGSSPESIKYCISKCDEKFKLK